MCTKVLFTSTNFECFKKILKGQSKQWFNLGNNQKFIDPLSAAEYLLQREYGDTSLFKLDRHEPVFIPAEIACSQYGNDSSIAVLDFDVDEQMKRTLENLQKESTEHWKRKNWNLSFKHKPLRME